MKINLIKICNWVGGSALTLPMYLMCEAYILNYSCTGNRTASMWGNKSAKNITDRILIHRHRLEIHIKYFHWSSCIQKKKFDCLPVYSATHT